MHADIHMKVQASGSRKYFSSQLVRNQCLQITAGGMQICHKKNA